MKYIHISLSILAIALSCMSCRDNHSIAEDVATAELALASDDVSATREICDRLATTTNEKSSIAAKDWGRLSMLYMQLNERTDDPEVVELAAQCYKEAFKVNADSASAYYQNLPVEYDKYAMTLATIVHSLDNPAEIPADHDLDVSADTVQNY